MLIFLPNELEEPHFVKVVFVAWSLGLHFRTPGYSLVDGGFQVGLLCSPYWVPRTPLAHLGASCWHPWAPLSHLGAPCWEPWASLPHFGTPCWVSWASLSHRSMTRFEKCDEETPKCQIHTTV